MLGLILCYYWDMSADPEPSTTHKRALCASVFISAFLVAHRTRKNIITLFSFIPAGKCYFRCQLWKWKQVRAFTPVLELTQEGQCPILHSMFLKVFYEYV